MSRLLQDSGRRARAGAVAIALAAAAGLHLAAFPQHLEEGAGVAAFFLVTAGAQLAGAVAVQRGVSRRGALVIGAGNLALVVLWALSRTVALPGVAHGGAAEPATWLDILAVVAEAVVVVGLFARPVSARLSSASVPWPATAAVAVVACAAALQWAPPTHAHDVPASTLTIVNTDEVREPSSAHKPSDHKPSDHKPSDHTHGPAR